MNRKHLTVTSIAAALSVGMVSGVHADPIEWGGGTGSWNDGSNWVGGEVPVIAEPDEAAINGGRIEHAGGSINNPSGYHQGSGGSGGDWTLNTSFEMFGGEWEQVSGTHALRVGDGGDNEVEHHAELTIHGGATLSTGTSNTMVTGFNNTGATITIHAGGMLDASGVATRSILASHGVAYSHDSYLDLLGGTFVTKELWIGHTNSDGQGLGASGRALITLDNDGSLEIDKLSIHNDANHRIDFAGAGSITTNSSTPIDYVTGPNNDTDLSWEWAWNQGYLTYQGSNSGSFNDHFEVVDNMDGTWTLIPEPGSLAMLGLGGLLMLRRRKA